MPRGDRHVRRPRVAPLLLLALLACSLATRARGAIVAEYRFTEGQAPVGAPPVVFDHAPRTYLGTLAANPITLRWSALRQGAEAYTFFGGTRARTNINTTTLLPALTDGITILLRIRVTELPPPGVTVVLAGFAGHPTSAPYTPCDGADPLHGGFRVLLRSDALYIEYLAVNTLSNALTCSGVGIIPTLHLDETLVFYYAPGFSGSLNFRVSATSGPAFANVSRRVIDPSRWTPNLFTIAPGHSDGAYRGFIRHVVIYNETVSEEQANALAASPYPNSAPYVAAALDQTVNEDVITPIATSCTDFDGDIATALVRSLPANGTLIRVGLGTPILPEDLPAPVGNLAYLSAQDLPGAFPFRVACSDPSGAVGREATITITVAPVNDAPSAFNATLSAYRGANVTISFPATDIQEPYMTAPLVSGVRLVTTPSNAGARLLRVDAGPTPGARFSAGDLVPIGGDQLVTAYYSGGPREPTDSGLDILATDSILFRAVDVDGAVSTIAQLTLLVRNPLQAYNETADVVMNTATSIQLGSADFSRTGPVPLRVHSLPAVGTLRQFGSGVPFTTVPAPVNDSLGRVVYEPPLDTFGPAGEDYHLTQLTFDAFDASRNTSSAVATLRLRVLPQNAAPILRLSPAVAVGVAKADIRVAIALADPDLFPPGPGDVYEIFCQVERPLGVRAGGLESGVEVISNDGLVLRVRAPRAAAQAVLGALIFTSSREGRFVARVIVSDLTPFGNTQSSVRVLLDVSTAPPTSTAAADSVSRLLYGIIFGSIAGGIALCGCCLFVVYKFLGRKIDGFAKL